MNKTSISWTQSDDGREGATWNPTFGCKVVSPGCANCYAMRMAGRFSGLGRPYEGLVTIGKNKRAIWNGNGHLSIDALDKPLHWRAPRRVFVNSMSDLFFERFTNEEIAAVFGIMAACPQHTFQILTKRAKRMREWFTWIDKVAAVEAQAVPENPWWRALYCLKAASNLIGEVPAGGYATWPLSNVWIGVSTENQATADERIPDLLHTPAVVRFLSCEPLLSQIDLSPWLSNHVGQDQESGRIRLQGGAGRRFGDRPGRSDLENSRPQGESLGQPSPVSSMRTPTSRTSWNDGVPDRTSDGRLETNDSTCSSTSVVPLHRDDPRRVDDQSQERKQGGQPTGQSRTGHRFGADDSREPSAWNGSGSESTRRTESARETYGRADHGDQRSSISRRETGCDRSALRSHVPAHFDDRARSQSISWIISGCESGPNARPCSYLWLRDLRDQCKRAGVAYFLKQAKGAYEEGDGITTGASRRHANWVVTGGKGSRKKPGGIFELPYLDGVQHKSFPEVDAR